MNTQILNQIGLNDSEIKVYFALLELETSTIGPIIEKAKVPDSKIYLILDKLKEKGLIGFVIKNNVKHFHASDPNNLINLLNEREEAIKKQKSELKEKIIPEIERKRAFAEEKQEAIVYESFQGVKAALNYLLSVMKKGEEYRVFTLGEALGKKEIIKLFYNYHTKRVELGIKAKLIAPIDLRKIVKEFYNYKLMGLRFTNLKLPVGTFIFKNHVMTVILEDTPTAFVIKSKNNYERYKEFFDEIWEKAKTQN